MSESLSQRMERYLEGTMSPEERAGFLRELEADHPSSYRALLALEKPRRVADDLEPDPWFTARVLKRLDEHRRRPLARLRQALFAPLNVRVRPASLVLGTGISLMLFFGWAPLFEPVPSIIETLPREVSVELRFDLPHAGSVSVVGDFNGWIPDRTPLVPVGDGEWIARLKLPPGVYQYQFVVDGNDWVPDPRAATQVDDGFGNRNSVLAL